MSEPKLTNNSKTINNFAQQTGDNGQALGSRSLPGK